MIIDRCRAWSKEGKRMVEVATIDFIKRVVTHHVNIEGNKYPAVYILKFDDIYLMRSSGLRSKDDKDEIFAGDWVRIVGRGFSKQNIYEVIDWGYKFVLSGRNHTTHKIGLQDMHENYEYEILGNIHENPDFLKEATK